MPCLGTGCVCVSRRSTGAASIKIVLHASFTHAAALASVQQTVSVETTTGSSRDPSWPRLSGGPRPAPTRLSLIFFSCTSARAFEPLRPSAQRTMDGASSSSVRVTIVRPSALFGSTPVTYSNRNVSGLPSLQDSRGITHGERTLRVVPAGRSTSASDGMACNQQHSQPPPPCAFLI